MLSTLWNWLLPIVFHFSAKTSERCMTSHLHIVGQNQNDNVSQYRRKLYFHVSTKLCCTLRVHYHLSIWKQRICNVTSGVMQVDLLWWWHKHTTIQSKTNLCLLLFSQRADEHTVFVQFADTVCLATPRGRQASPSTLRNRFLNAICKSVRWPRWLGNPVVPFKTVWGGLCFGISGDQLLSMAHFWGSRLVSWTCRNWIPCKLSTFTVFLCLSYYNTLAQVYMKCNRE